MIEVTYSENGQAVQAPSAPVKIPKNIRQIGEIHSKRKIYIEDYVITYLKQIAKKEDNLIRAAVLLGETKKTEGICYTFASGAVETEKIEIDYEGIQFTDEAWTDIYEKVKNFFDDLEVVGWMLIVPGMSMAVNGDIVTAHTRNFSGNDKIFLMMDIAEGEESFYVYDNGDLVRQKGYYIYFEKNPAMQDYMIYKNQNVSIEVKEKAEDRAAVSFRTIVQEKHEDQHQKKMMSFMYAASTFLVMVVLVMGITMTNNYDKMKNMEQSLAVISDTITGGSEETTGTDLIPVETVPADVTPETPEQDEKGTEEQGQASPEEPKEDNKDEEPQETSSLPATYTVQKGDTIAIISEQIYGDRSMIQAICEANNLGDGNRILVGQVLTLPER